MHTMRAAFQSLSRIQGPALVDVPRRDSQGREEGSRLMGPERSANNVDFLRISHGESNEIHITTRIVKKGT